MISREAPLSAFDIVYVKSPDFVLFLGDEALELMLEVILSKRPYIRIAGDDFPREIVKSRFLKINSGHLEYVFDCINKNTTKVGNIKAYLLDVYKRQV